MLPSSRLEVPTVGAAECINKFLFSIWMSGDHVTGRPLPGSSGGRKPAAVQRRDAGHPGSWRQDGLWGLQQLLPGHGQDLVFSGYGKIGVQYTQQGPRRRQMKCWALDIRGDTHAAKGTWVICVPLSISLHQPISTRWKHENCSFVINPWLSSSVSLSHLSPLTPTHRPSLSLLLWEVSSFLPLAPCCDLVLCK